METRIPQEWLPTELRESVRTEEYPALFQEGDWGLVRVRFRLEPPPEELTASVNLLPTTGKRWLLIQHGEGGLHRPGEWSIPGGTREPNEPIQRTALRELQEETGLIPLQIGYFGAWECHSTQPRPYRAWVPHPVFYRLVGLARLASDLEPPPSPPSPEIRRVAFLPLNAAAAHLERSDRGDLADLLRLAAWLWERWQAAKPLLP